MMATKFSCEPYRKSAYHEDLRWRMVWQRKAQGLKLAEVAKNLSVDTSTVQRVVARFDATGQVKKKKYRIPDIRVKISKPVALTILQLILEKPDIYLWELQQELRFLFGLEVCEATICKFLKKSNFSRKKLRLIAIQRDAELRARFITDVAIYSQHHLVFVDETGCDRRDATRKYGYGLRGKAASCQKLLVRGERISVIAAMTNSCILDLKVVRGSVSGADYIEFINTNLLPHLMPFNGINPNSVVVLDNCSIHHVTEAVEAMQQNASLVHFLPPYSPDYNPIELLFSKVKGVLRAMETELGVTDDIETLVLSAFASVSSDDCRAWVDSVQLY